MEKGHFFVFEGIDGSGKTTQINLLKKRLEENGMRCCVTREPSDGPVGVLLRQCLSGRLSIDERSMAALFAADRLDHLCNGTDGICRQLEQGIHVICDRYFLSNYAYQSVSVPLEWIMELNKPAMKILKPDCHIILDVDPLETNRRMDQSRVHKELFENESRLTAVREAYFKLAEQLGATENILIIDGHKSIDAISDEIWHLLTPLFGNAIL